MKDHSAPGVPPARKPDAPELEGQTLVTQITELSQNVSRIVEEMTVQLDGARRRRVPTSHDAVELAQALKGAIVARGPDEVGKLLRRAPSASRRDAA